MNVNQSFRVRRREGIRLLGWAAAAALLAGCGSDSTGPVDPIQGAVLRLHTMSPNAALEGDQPVRVTLTGAGFAPDARIDWGGQQYVPVSVQEGRLVFDVPASAFETAGTTAVAIVNPTPTARMSDTLYFTVGASAVHSVVLDPPTLPLEVGASATIAASVYGPHGRVLRNRTIFWQSSRPAVATVDEAGIVRARAEGTATISALVEGVRAEVRVSVGSAPEPVRYVVPGPQRGEGLLGVPFQFTVRVLGAGFKELQGKTVTWWIESPEIATIDEQGRAVGLKKGVTRVRAESEGVVGWATFEVFQVPEGSVHTYELRIEGYLPTVDTTTWVDANGAPRAAQVVLDGGSLTLDFRTNAYRQTFEAVIVVGSHFVGRKEYVDEGTYAYWMPQGTLRFTSTTQPGRAFDAVPSQGVSLTTRQKVGTAPVADYRFVIR